MKDQDQKEDKIYHRCPCGLVHDGPGKYCCVEHGRWFDNKSSREGLVQLTEFFDYLNGGSSNG